MQILRVRDVMTRNVDVVSERERVTARRLLPRFRAFHHLPVVGPRRRVVGMLTPSDVLWHAERWGNRLVPASALMSAPVATVEAFAPIAEAARQMTERGVHALVVVKPGGTLLGIVTSTDLLEALSGAGAVSERAEELPVDELMTANPVTVSPDTPAADAARLLAETGARHLPVIDEAGVVVGMISDRDIVQQLHADVMLWPDAATERLEEPVSSLMTPNPTVLYGGTPLAEAFDVFAEERLEAVPVVDDRDRLLGILSYVDVLRWLRNRARRPGEAPRSAVHGPH